MDGNYEERGTDPVGRPAGGEVSRSGPERF
ncbi:MAG: hypothetical protein ACI9NQ_001278 [Paracoccaceae bacterium]|jgi:hypothetical protein